MWKSTHVNGLAYLRSFSLIKELVTWREICYMYAKFKLWDEQMISLDLTNNLKAEASEITCRHDDNSLGLSKHV